MYTIGSIVKITNMIFKDDGNQKRHSIDHSFMTGRPCVVIAEDDDDVYFLPIKSRKKVYGHESPLDSKYSVKESCVNIENIYKKPICFLNEFTKLDNKDLLILLSNFIKYQTTVKKDEHFDNVINNINETIIKISNNGNIKSAKRN